MKTQYLTKKWLTGVACPDASQEWQYPPDSSYVVLIDYSERDSLPDAYLIYYTSDFEKKVLEKFTNINGYSLKGYFHSFNFNIVVSNF